jgi:hypothetical protein
MTMRFSNSPTLYTLTLSRDGQTLTSAGNDNTPVQTYHRVQMQP